MDCMDDFLAEQSETWRKFAQQCKVVPSTNPYNPGNEKVILFRMISFDHLPIPKVLLDKSNKSSESVYFHLSATLFDSKAKGKDSGAFLGNTWTGERMKLSECCTLKTDVKWNKRDSSLNTVKFGSEYGFVFYTSQNTNDLKIVIECVVTIYDEKGSPLEEYGICWCCCSLQSDVADTPKSVLEPKKVDAIYSGTPRLLFFTDANLSQLKKARMEPVSASFKFMEWDDLKRKALHLMVENDLCGGGDRAYGAIPGLVSTVPPQDSTDSTRIHGFVQLNSELSTLEEFEISLVETCFQLPSLFQQRLLSDLISANAIAAKDPKITYLADIGVHNGRRFIGSSSHSPYMNGNRIIELERTAGDAYKIGRVPLRCMASNLISIVVVLKALIKSNDKVSTVCLGWISIVPWRENDLVLGNYNVRLIDSAPFVSVCKLPTFENAGKSEPLYMTTSLRYEGLRSSLDINDVVKTHAPAVSPVITEIPATSGMHHIDKVISDKAASDDGYKSTSDSDAEVVDPVPEPPSVKRVKSERNDARVDVSEHLDSAASSVVAHEDAAAFAKGIDVHGSREKETADASKNTVPAPVPSAAVAAPAKTQLKELRLRCYTPNGVDEVGQIRIESSWNEVQASVQDRLGCLANLIFEDNNGDDVTVDGDAGWKALVKLVQDDWEGECQLDGEIEVDIVPVEPPHSSAATDPPAVASQKAVARPEEQVPKLQPPALVTEISKVGKSEPALHRPEVAVLKTDRSANTDPLSPRHLAGLISQNDKRVDGPSSTANTRPDKSQEDSGTGSAVISQSDKLHTGAASAMVGRKIHSDSVSDENSPPSNRITKITRSKDVKRGGGAAAGSGRAVLSTDSSDMEDSRHKADTNRGRRRRAREYQVQNEETIPGKDSDFHRVPGRPEVPSSLSRALRAKLFTSTISSMIQYHRADVPFTDWTQALNSASDISSVGGCEDIVVQILAVKLPESSTHVYFTFNFYHFPPVETPVAALERIPQQDLQGSQEANCPAILRVLDGSQQGSGVAGIMIHFVVDSSQDPASKQNTPPAFFRYLSSRILCIDMWDAVSRLPIGTARIDLRVLLRHGQEAIQTGGEFALTAVDSPQASDGSFPKEMVSATSPASSQDSVFIRLVSVLRHPATDSPEVASTNESTILAPDKSPTSGMSVAKGLALLFVKKSIVLEALQGVSGTISTARLQDAIISARLELTAKEVTELALHMTSNEPGCDAACVNRIRIGGQDVLDKCTDRRNDLLSLINIVQRNIALRYNGDINNFFEDNSLNGTMTLQQMMKILENDNQDLVARLVSLAGDPAGSGLTLSQFSSFFGVVFNSNDSGGVPSHIDKKLARWQRLRDKRQASTQLSAHNDCQDQQLFLEAAKRMREVHKESQIKQFLQKCITTRETIYPSFGQVSYVPYLLCSPFSEVRVIAIHTDSPDLVLVTDVNEWRELERHSTRSMGIVEDDLFSREGRDYTVCLQPHQKVVVPFIMRIMSPEQMLLDREDLRGHVTAQEESERPAALKSEAVRQRVISVTFSACAADGHRGPPLYVLELEVRPRPFVVDHTFRLYHGKNDFMKRKIILDTSLDVDGCSWRGGAPRGGPSWQRNLKHVWCSNPGVVIASSAASSDSDKQDIHIKYRCGEAGHEDSFYLLLYNDAWHVALYEIWHIYVTSLNRMDVEGLVGQTEPTAVMVRARDGPHPVRAFSSAPAVVSFPQPGRTIDAGLSEYPLDFHPLHPGRRDVLVHVVHAAQPPHALARRDKPLSAWLLATTARMPLISRRYDIRLPLGRVANKKILYTNPYGFAPDLSHQVLCHVANQEGSEAGAGKALPHDDANLY